MGIGNPVSQRHGVSPQAFGRFRIRTADHAVDRMEDDTEYDIAVARVTDAAPDCETRLRGVIEATLHRHATTSARITIALVDDARIARLNEEHLGHSGPTDVLAFDLRDSAGADRTHEPGSEPRDKNTCAPDLEGEIVVSVDTAIREASARGHGVVAELSLYAVHGTLHLLGYGDADEAEAARMHKIEDEILSSVGLGVVYGADLP